MQTTRIAELLEPFLGAANQWPTPEDPLYNCISMYIDILRRWNIRINLTAIRDPEEIVTRHFGESIFAARHLFAKVYPVRSVSSGVEDFDGLSDISLAPDAHVADLGSGAGFPGIPIKLLAPDTTVTLIEANHKKATFLREVVRTLKLTKVNIENQRAEDLRTKFDLVTLRAVERFSLAVRVASHLVGTAGWLALLTSSRQFETIKSTVPLFVWKAPIPIPLSESRILAIGRRHSK